MRLELEEEFSDPARKKAKLNHWVILTINRDSLILDFSLVFNMNLGFLSDFWSATEAKLEKPSEVSECSYT